MYYDFVKCTTKQYEVNILVNVICIEIYFQLT